MTDQRWLRIIPVTFVMYTIAFIDRTNLSLALPSMSRELHIDAAQAGAASGIFFLGYVLPQIPMGYLASRWSPKKLVGILLVAWGFCSAATGLVHSWHELLIARFLLGLAEAGVWPATLVLLANWFPRIERARANAYWMLCLPVAVVVSSPISGWIISRWDWRVLLVSEGLVPICWLVIWLATIDDEPRKTKWIAADERDFLVETLRRETQQTESQSRESFISSVFSRRVLTMLVIALLTSAGNYGYLFWLPSILESASLEAGREPSQITTGILNALPYVFAAAGMVAISKSSDRRKERAVHTFAAMGWAGILLIASALIAAKAPIIAFGLLCLVSAGSFGMAGPYWAIPTEILPPAMAGAALGLIQIGNLGGALGPTLIGFLDKQTGGFTAAFVVLGIGWLIAAVLCLFLKPEKPHSATEVTDRIEGK
jgi:MFS family permease